MINEGKYTLIIDVMEGEKYTQYHILGATLIPLHTPKGIIYNLKSDTSLD